MRRLLWAILAAILTLLLVQDAKAQCSPVGWAVGIAFSGDSATYYFEGPLETWTSSGVVDSDGSKWVIDARPYAEAQTVILRIELPDGRRLSTPLLQVPGLCGFASEPNEAGERIIFGNVLVWGEHYHPDVRPTNHETVQQGS